MRSDQPKRRVLRLYLELKVEMCLRAAKTRQISFSIRVVIEKGLGFEFSNCSAASFPRRRNSASHATAASWVPVCAGMTDGLALLMGMTPRVQSTTTIHREGVLPMGWGSTVHSAARKTMGVQFFAVLGRKSVACQLRRQVRSGIARQSANRVGIMWIHGQPETDNGRSLRHPSTTKRTIQMSRISYQRIAA
jgi:hypothetical protein